MATEALPLRDDPNVMSLLDLLNDPRYQSQRQEFTSLLDYVDELTNRYSSIIDKLDVMSEKLSTITDKKNPLSIMFERLSGVMSGIGDKLKSLKDSIVDFAKNTLESAKDKSLSALGAMSETLHMHERLESISNSLGNAAARCENLEHFHQERVSANEAAKEAISAGEQQITLAELLADTRVDFENLTPDELNTVYGKLLKIGMDGDLTAAENACLQDLTEEAESLLPERREAAHTQEIESEINQGEEI